MSRDRDDYRWLYLSVRPLVIAIRASLGMQPIAWRIPGAEWAHLPDGSVSVRVLR